MEIDPGDILQEARVAFSDKKYSLSLEKYRWFFDNALKIKKSYYGVRLSYCLSEWADLGNSYPPALDYLIKQKELSLKTFKETKSCGQFHEYSRICDALDCPNEPVEVFLEIASVDKALSDKIFKFVYEELARQSQWVICREYMGNGYNQYKEILELFDACVQGGKRKGGDQGEGIINSSIERTVEELLWILRMQAFAKANDEIQSALGRIKHDYGKRGYVQIYDQVSKKAPNKANYCAELNSEPRDSQGRDEIG
ncbi:MAG: hypothetical protein KZQ99_20735 [Candidatus Thiodiazotropha sp. (ex Dulcina madagascariensis)]|nr:hypothetical protein [Candidatus Thiodiazotropha sp. (ex Dulcina madagascariensis)]